MSKPGADERFRQLYDQYQRPVLAYFLRRTDQPTALDGAAETFLVAWRRIDDVPQGDRALPWLYGVARRVLANLRRGETRRRSLTSRLGSEASGDVEPSPESVVVRRTEDEQMIRVLTQLRPADQEIIRLSVWEELSNSDIATMFDTTPHAISQRLHRITRRLAHDLQRPSVHRARPAPATHPEGGDAQ